MEDDTFAYPDVPITISVTVTPNDLDSLRTLEALDKSGIVGHIITLVEEKDNGRHS